MIINLWNLYLLFLCLVVLEVSTSLSWRVCEQARRCNSSLTLQKFIPSKPWHMNPKWIAQFVIYIFSIHLKFNIAPKNIPSQKESSLPTLIFQGAMLNFVGVLQSSFFLVAQSSWAFSLSIFTEGSCFKAAIVCPNIPTTKQRGGLAFTTTNRP